MLRRSFALWAAGVKEFSDFTLKEHLIQNYEGWRILDNPQYDNLTDYWMRDPCGYVRHLDPIIDDPRLLHRQRVRRLYRWALKELQHTFISLNEPKMNLAHKVVRNRFEKYRYVTDPAMCDMMVREAQVYLRETCNYTQMRQIAYSPNSNAQGNTPMFHPDNSLVYDHWVQNEVFWYDDAKLHRFVSHHPIYSGAGEMSHRYADDETLSPTLRKYGLIFGCGVILLYFLSMQGILYWRISSKENLEFIDDPFFTEWNKQFDPVTQGTILAAERNSRMRNDGGSLRYDWDKILGSVKQKVGVQKYGAFLEATKEK